VIYNFSRKGKGAEGLKTEVNHGPIMVDNNVFVRSRFFEEGNGTLVAHNLFLDCVFWFKASPIRVVPYYEPHSTVRAGSEGTTLRHQKIYNNITICGDGIAGGIGKIIDEREGSITGFTVNNNVYLDGAGKFDNQDNLSVVDGSDAGAEFIHSPDSVLIRFKLPSSVFIGNYPLITSEFMGKVSFAEMFMEHPDGTPLDITSDFYGNPVDPNKVLPGPFQNITPGENSFTLWPKTLNVEDITGCMDPAYEEYDATATVNDPAACQTLALNNNAGDDAGWVGYADGRFVVSVPVPGRHSLKLFDLKGSQVFSREFSQAGTHTFDISLPRGIYRMFITGHERNISKKIAVL